VKADGQPVGLDRPAGLPQQGALNLLPVGDSPATRHRCQRVTHTAGALTRAVLAAVEARAQQLGAPAATTLGLKIEITGHPDRHLEHDATIPELLVPRLVEGLRLPVIVEHDRVEVQWHLV